MPMSPRLLRPRATAALVAVDADARAYINAVRAADGGQYMEPAVQLAIDNFVIGCKSDGIWTAVVGSCILIGARTLSGALTPVKGNAPTNVNFVTGDYDRKTGLSGNASNKSLNTEYKNDDFGQNDVHLSVYASAIASSGTFYIGNTFATGWTAIYRTSTNINFTARSTSASAAVAATGFLGIARANSTQFRRHISGSTTTVANVSQVPGNEGLRVFSNSGGTEASNAKIAFYSVGANLDLALLDSRVSTLCTAIGASIL